MEGISVIIPCYNKLELTRSCINSLSRITDTDIEFIIIDNGSTDSTAEFLKTLTGKFRSCLNKENLGMVRAFNLGASMAKHDVLVFMHNDVIIHDSDWPGRIRVFLDSSEGIGIAGLYGARKIRKDGSFLGRGIVHSKLEGGDLQQDHIEVAVIDGLFMAMKKTVYDEIGKFDEGYTMHYYDKDISMKSHKSGYGNYVLNIPFTHTGAGTRSAFKAEADNKLRDEMNNIFIGKWKDHLPLDVRTKGSRIKDWIRKYV